VVCDHGHEPVKEHFDLGPRIAKELGAKTAYHSSRAWRFNPEVICAVSGNAMAHLYLKKPMPELTDWLLTKPAIDIVATREPESNKIRVDSRRGSAMLSEKAGRIKYKLLTTDPFGYATIPKKLDHETALQITAATGHPDGLLQLAQIFRSGRTGDVVVSATPGFDLRDRFERPEHRSSHGALHVAHMSVPLAISSPVEGGPVRTADVFSMVLEHLGIATPAGVDGRSRLLGLAQSAADPALAPLA
jgi:hypothetical protein